MRRAWRAFGLRGFVTSSWLSGAFLSCVLLSGGAGASEPPAASPTVADTVRRDPQGLRGVSPFIELIDAGQRAYLARDFEGALAHFRQATQKEPQKALGHLRMAEAQARLGQLEDAFLSLDAALRFSERDRPLRARVLFLRATLEEREGLYSNALTTWDAYLRLAPAAPETLTVTSQGPVTPAPEVFVETARQRAVRLAARRDQVEAYKAVRERMQTELDGAQKAAEKNAK